MNLLGKILATGLLALEEGGLGYSNPATIPSDVATFAQGIIEIWKLNPTGTAASASKLEKLA